MASRLIRSRGDLDSQKGGIGLRGPGETLLETDRRLLKLPYGAAQSETGKSPPNPYARSYCPSKSCSAYRVIGRLYQCREIHPIQ